MDNKEAIDVLYKFQRYGVRSGTIIQAIEMGIEALQAQDHTCDNCKKNTERPLVKFRYCGKNLNDIDIYSCMGCGERISFWDDAKPQYCPFCGAKGEVYTYGV